MFIICYETKPTGKMTPVIRGFHGRSFRGRKGFVLDQSRAIKYKTKKGAETAAKANLPEGYTYKILSI